MVMRGVLRATLLGAAVGLLGTLPATGALESHVFGITTHDPRILIVATGFLLAAGVAAAALAATRATRVDPLDALRSE
jgi:ABC-type antimicrobial peptide transport system permease subunit